MTTRYRVEYALKTHRRDQLIEWIKALLAVPFVLHSNPAALLEPQVQQQSTNEMAAQARRKYLNIMEDLEILLNDHIAHQRMGTADRSKLKLLIPSVGTFFTPLPLSEAFVYQDQKRCISNRRFVAPSFNDVRVVLNTAQVLSLVGSRSLRLVTFDGDVTLYEDGKSLDRESPVVSRLLRLLSAGIKVAIVTAAGYTEAQRYYERLKGLLDRVHEDSQLALQKPTNLIVMGGESNFLFKYSDDAPFLLEHVPRDEWMLDEMKQWSNDDIQSLLDIAEVTLKDCVRDLQLKATLIRRERAVGIIPTPDPTGASSNTFPREALEEVVLVTQRILETSEPAQRIPFCAFNGGNDVFVDIGDKSWGVRACQHFFRDRDPSSANGDGDGSNDADMAIGPASTLHTGDQFLSAGANDFKARVACTTAWIANPAETVQLLDEIIEHESTLDRKLR